LTALVSSELKLEVASSAISISSLTPTAADVVSIASALRRENLLATTTATAETPLMVQGLFLSLREPVASGTVPATSVFTTRGGKSCVFKIQDGTQFAVDVSASLESGAQIGVAQVTIDLLGSRIVRDPSTLPAEVTQTCG
jgi:hypothetical protein